MTGGTRHERGGRDGGLHRRPAQPEPDELHELPAPWPTGEKHVAALDPPVAEAAAGGARLAVLPEATSVRFGRDALAAAEPLDGPFVTGLAEAAREHGVAVLAGVFEPAGDGRVYNTTVAIDEQGRIAGTYRKIHLFDSFGARESQFVAPGDTPVVVELAGLRIGLITCYDLRFPELPRALSRAGAELLVVPSAWVAGPRKVHHWRTLVTARAIENVAYVAAVCQSAIRSRG